MALTIVKVGTGVLTHSKTGTLNSEALSKLVCGLAKLVHDGHRVILVSSGAVGAGVSALQLTAYPQEIEKRQAAAAVGQVRLMEAYQNLFSSHQLHVAQLLLSAADLKNSKRTQHINNTLSELLAQGNIIPIVNENDTVATKELRIGDNDQLSAELAVLINADQLILLTTVDGLLNEEGQLIETVENLDSVTHHAKDSKGNFSMGGMASKLTAIQHALENNIPTWIANGQKADQINQIIEGAIPSTRFTL